MDLEMQKANLLVVNIKGFIEFVHNSQENNYSFSSNSDQLYRLKLLIEEFKFKILADELSRINKFTWDEKYTGILVDRIRAGITNIDEYTQNNYSELFIFTARLYSIQSICSSFHNI